MRDSIAHVFFDLDHTLWDFETNSRLAVGELFDRFGVGRLTGAGEDEFHAVYVRINEVFWERYRLGTITKGELRSGRFFDALDHFGLRDAALAEAMGTAYVDISPRKTALMDGAMEVLHYLGQRYELHIITNGFEEVQHIKLESSGIRPFFSEVVTSERAGVRKPDPGIFRFAEQLTGAQRERSLMIGDHLEADILGAQRAGWRAIHFDPGAQAAGEGHRIASLRELTALL
jgi:putative hydrolase of the HAD superfamily